jgi:hypothetical protein
MSDTSDTSDTSSISSDTDRSEVSDELQQEWKDALTQCQRIQELHNDILQRMDHLSKRLYPYCIMNNHMNLMRY